MTAEIRSSKVQSKVLRVGFLLLPGFTMLPFSAFLDTLRLASDEEDYSRQVHCNWTLMGERSGEPIPASNGVTINSWQRFEDPNNFDYVVVVGGIRHSAEDFNAPVLEYLKRTAASKATLVGLCTASFALIHAGLMAQRPCCVSWYHYPDLLRDYPDITPVVDQLFVDDGDIITCAGGTAAADLALYLVERHLGRERAEKSLRILVMDQARSASSPQPAPPDFKVIKDWRIRAVLAIMEKHQSQPLTTDQLAAEIGISRRQLERLFNTQTGKTVQSSYRQIRTRYSEWLLEKSDFSIAKIAQETGFADAAHFTRSFKKVYGVTPNQYRRSLS